MKRLYLTVEGQTEQAFAVNVLQPHLLRFDVHVWKPRLTGPHRRHRGRIPQGGLLNSFDHSLEDIKRWLKEDSSPDARFSMMVDLYSLPTDFPGHAAASPLHDPLARATRLEQELSKVLNDERFIPYLQVHEFEALILARPEVFLEWFDNVENDVQKLKQECSPFPTPEHINSGQHTHPKARIRKYLPAYTPNVEGPVLAGDVGIETIKSSCAHFSQWITKLEQLDR